MISRTQIYPELAHGAGRRQIEMRGSQIQLQHGTGHRLYIGGVPNELGVGDIRTHFSRWGTVEDVYFPRLRRGERANYCFVRFTSREAAQRSFAQSSLRIAGKVSWYLTLKVGKYGIALHKVMGR